MKRGLSVIITRVVIANYQAKLEHFTTLNIPPPPRHQPTRPFSSLGLHQRALLLLWPLASGRSLLHVRCRWLHAGRVLGIGPPRSPLEKRRGVAGLLPPPTLAFRPGVPDFSSPLGIPSSFLITVIKPQNTHIPHLSPARFWFCFLWVSSSAWAAHAEPPQQRKARTARACPSALVVDVLVLVDFAFHV